MSAKAALAAAMGRLEAALAGERERWALWLPVCLGLGVALYFALAVEPPLWLGAAGVAEGGDKLHRTGRIVGAILQQGCVDRHPRPHPDQHQRLGSPSAARSASQAAAEARRALDVVVGGEHAEAQDTLLFFVSPTCPICKVLLPVVDSIAKRERGALRVIYASDGDRGEHREFVV
ncbi:MAG: hypothetical protein IH806_12380, partial [Proteobacteria bacterium]|nr:hypothetical protein [Pseudomonadota bacterium]